MNRPSLAEYSLPSGGHFRVDYARTSDARNYLAFNAAHAEPHRRDLFQPDESQAVVGLAYSLRRLQRLAEWEPRSTYNNGQLTVARYAIGAFAESWDGGESVASVAKINARYPYDQRPFITQEEAEAQRPAKWLRALGVKTPALKDDRGNLQQEVFELSVDQGVDIPHVEAITLLPLADRLPAATEVHATLDAENKHDRDLWTLQFGAEQVAGPVKDQTTGRHAIQVMVRAGELTSLLQMHLEQAGIGRYV